MCSAPETVMFRAVQLLRRCCSDVFSSRNCDVQSCSTPKTVPFGSPAIHVIHIEVHTYVIHIRCHRRHPFSMPGIGGGTASITNAMDNTWDQLVNACDGIQIQCHPGKDPGSTGSVFGGVCSCSGCAENSSRFKLGTSITCLGLNVVALSRFLDHAPSHSLEPPSIFPAHLLDRS